MEPSWNLTSGPPRTTPEPIWAETPKLSAVGEKQLFPTRKKIQIKIKYKQRTTQNKKHQEKPKPRLPTGRRFRRVRRGQRWPWTPPASSTAPRCGSAATGAPWAERARAATQASAGVRPFGGRGVGVAGFRFVWLVGWLFVCLFVCLLGQIVVRVCVCVRALVFWKEI